MSDVSVVVLTTGEDTTKRAIESLNKQTLQPVETIIIENITPFHNAINAGIKRVKTDYFIQVDSDFVLDENCIEMLRNSMLPGVAITIGQLRDPISGIESGVKLYRTSSIRNKRFNNSISPETDIIKELYSDGWRIVYPISTDSCNGRINTLGEHSPGYTPLYTYLRFYRRGLAIAYRKEAHYIEIYFEKLRKSDHPYALIAQIAFSNGLFGDTDAYCLSPEYFETSPSEINFLENFLVDNGKFITNGFDVSTINRLDPITMFSRFIELGKWLRNNYTLRGFKYYLDVINRCDKEYCWVGNAALCHGISFEDQNKYKENLDYKINKISELACT